MDSELNNNVQNKNNSEYKNVGETNGASTATTNGHCSVQAENTEVTLTSSISQMELQEYDRPPGREKNNLIKCEDLEHYVKTMTENNGFKDQYNMLKFGPQKPCTEGSKPENKPKNRYFDLIPYDESRVVLQPLKDDPNSDYINANYCDAYNHPNGYICTQGPLEKTVVDFWRMIWQEFVCKIVMAANIIEFGKVGKSCRRLVRQFHFTGWPDHGVPVYPLSLLYMLKSMKSFQPNSKGPVVLHCSAGVGRSGTVMLLDSAYDMAIAEKKVDIFGLLYKMRQQRINLVETLEQFIFVHKTLAESLFADVPCVPASHLVMYYNKLRLNEKDNQKTRLQLQYEKLTKLTPPLPNERFIAAQAPDYKCKNRSELILSPECGRPVLRAGASQNYINAVFVNGYGKENAFLATQFPLHETVKDFWQLVYETSARTIVILNDIPKNDDTCPVFWPESGSLYYGSIKLDHTTTDQVPNFKIRQLKLKNVDESKRSRTIKQFHMTGWSKDDVALPSVEGIIRLLMKVEKWQAKSGNHPIIVCCFNGNKACGMYCAASYMSDHILNEKEVDVFTAVRTIRLNRPQFVPKEQYRWLYEIGCALSKAYGHC